MDLKEVIEEIESQLTKNEQYARNYLLGQGNNLYIKEQDLYKGVEWKDVTYKGKIKVLVPNGTEKQQLDDIDIEIIMPKGITAQKYFWIISPDRK